jgi:Tfp pilus assembly protein PilF
MRKTVLRKAALAGMAATICAGALWGQAWRGGHGRVEGTVKDPQGNPIENATVSMRLQQGASSSGPDIKTNKKGHWAILGVVGGVWNVDISAPGYQTKQVQYPLKEFDRNPNMDVVLEPEVQKQAPKEEISVGGKKISKETADALDKGNTAWNEALKAQETKDACRSTPAPGKDSADAIAQCEKDAESVRKAKFGEATALYEQSLPELSDNTALMTKLEMAGYLTQNYDQAEKYAKMITEKEPGNTTSWMMIAELEVQKGNLAEAKAAVEKVPADKLTDPTVFLNIGVICYNKNLPADAEQYFSKAIDMKGDFSEAYYYRGLARYQIGAAAKNKQTAAEKFGEAKADFQKYMQIDPNGKDADTVKELLKSIK